MEAIDSRRGRNIGHYFGFLASSFYLNFTIFLITCGLLVFPSISSWSVAVKEFRNTNFLALATVGIDMSEGSLATENMFFYGVYAQSSNGYSISAAWVLAATMIMFGCLLYGLFNVTEDDLHANSDKKSFKLCTVVFAGYNHSNTEENTIDLLKTASYTQLDMLHKLSTVRLHPDERTCFTSIGLFFAIVLQIGVLGGSIYAVNAGLEYEQNYFFKDSPNPTQTFLAMTFKAYMLVPSGLFLLRYIFPFLTKFMLKVRRKSNIQL